MNKLWFLLFSLGMLIFVACDKDEDTHGHEDESISDYEALIHSPDAEDKRMEDVIQLNIEFKEHDGGKVHHVNVKIYEDGNPDNVIYDAPTEAHVHVDGLYEYRDEFMLNSTNGVEAHSDWIIEAKVWGHEDGLDEVMTTSKFHVHPM